MARNALSGGGRYVVAALIALAVTPYAFHTLGEQRFGLWALAGAIVATVRVFDLGLTRAVVRSVATATGRGSAAQARSPVATARGLMIVLGALAFGTAWLTRDILVVLLHVPPDLQPVARFVLVGVAGVAAVEGVFAPFQATLDGVGRMDLSSGVDAVQRVLSAVGTVVVLALGWGLVGLVWKNLATALLAGVAYRLLAGRLASGIVGGRPRIERAEAAQLLGLGRHVQLVALSALAMDVGAKLVLSRAAGLAAVGRYELAVRVAAQVGGALLAVALALFPAAAEARAGAGPDGDRALLVVYRRGTRYLAWVALPALGLLAALAEPFARAWLGPDYGPVGRAMAVLALGWLVATLAVPAHLVAQAGGRPRVSSAAAATTTAVALGLAVVLVPSYGLSGVVLALTVGLAAGAVVVWWGFARAFATGWATLRAVGWRGPLFAAAGALTARTAAAVVPWLGATLPGVVVAGGLGLGLYAMLLVVTGEVGPVDRALARGVLGRGTS